MSKSFRVLGIESSCDETAAAVVEGGRHILSNVISSQVDIHHAYFGVVPELASRAHLHNIQAVIPFLIFAFVNTFPKASHKQC